MHTSIFRPAAGVVWLFLGVLGLCGSLAAQTPMITAPPLSKLAVAGESASFTVAATGAGPLTYQWIRNGQTISGATGPTLTIASATRGDTGWYQVVVTGSGGTARSAFALTVSLDTGALIAWGDGYPLDQTRVPAGLGRVAAIAAGWRSFVLRTDGSVASWSSGSGPIVVFDANVVGISANAHVLALRSDGTVAAAHDNIYGQATVPAGLAGIVAVAAGRAHSLVLKSDGTVRAWGHNANGETNVPETLANVVAIAAGGAHNLALKGDGTLLAWGASHAGQSTIPAGLAGVIAIAAGGGHSLALRGDGTVVAWGRNEYGQITVPPGLTSVIAIAAGGDHSLALKSDGTVVGWGKNWLGEATPPEQSRGAVAIAAGSAHSLAIVPAVAPAIARQPGNQSVAPGGALILTVATTGTRPLSYQWKKNGVALVDASNRIAGSASAMLTMKDVQADDAGAYTVEIGNAAGVVTSSAAALGVAAPPTITARPLSRIVVVGQALTLGASATGASPRTYQWRRNNQAIPGATNSSLGIPSATLADRGFYEVVVSAADGGVARSVCHVNVTSIPFTVAGVLEAPPWNGVPDWLYNVVAISAGTNTSMAVQADGTVAEWGHSGSHFSRARPPAGNNGVVAVTTGWDRSLALQADGTIASWSSSTVPAGLRNIVAVSVSGGYYGSYFVALLADGSVFDWNDYAPYDGADAAELTNVVAIATGDLGALALRADGTVRSWRGTAATPPAGLGNVIAIEAGETHFLALKSDGTVAAWGTGTAAVVPSGLSNVVAIAAGSRHSAALKADGSVVAWGDNSNRQTTSATSLSNVIAISAGSAHSLALVPATAPVITTQPVSQTVSGGQNVVLSVAATGSAPLYYQWRKNGANIPGATFSAYGLVNAIEADSGTYSVLVRNSGGSVLSANAAITVQEPNIAPVVRRVPLSVAAMGNADATFWVVAGGASPRTVQWYFGSPGDVSQPIPGATAFSVTVNSSTVSQRVWARITNALGTIDSPAAVALRWENADSGLGTYNLVMASYANGRFFLGSDFYFGSSLDAQTWSKQSIGGSYDAQVAYGNGIYVKGGGYYNGNVHTSADGVTWTPRPEAGVSDVSRVVFNGRLFVARTGSQTVHTSPDGLTWTLRVSTTQYVSAICAGQGKVIVVGQGGTIYSSADGITWTERPGAIAGGGVASALFANGRFIAATDSGGVWTSADGETWTSRASLYPAMSPLAGGGGVFLGSRYSGDLLVSTDPSTWTVFPNTLPGYSGATHFTYGKGRFLVTTWDGRFLRSLPLMGALILQNNPAVPAVLSGNSITLTISAAGTGLPYQWYRGWAGDYTQPIAGATSASYTTPALTQATPFWVRVANAAEAVESSTFHVVIAAAPLITQHPQSVDVIAGSPANVSIAAAGPPAPDFQWYAGRTGDSSQPIAGAAASSYIAPAQNLSSNYWARASTLSGSADSATATVTRWELRNGQVAAKQMTYFKGRYFVADGTRLLSSLDGRDWITAYQPVWPGFLDSVAHNGEMLVSIGDNLAVTSTDGVVFTPRDKPLDSAFECEMTFGNGVFVTAYGVPVWSADGITWTIGTIVNPPGAGGSPYFRSVCFAAGVFVAVGADNSSPNSWMIYRSTDGRTWNKCVVPDACPATLNTVGFGNGLFVVTGYSATIFTSPDGQTWTKRTAPTTAKDFRGVAFGNGTFVVGTEKSENLRSADGITWTIHSAPEHFSAGAIQFLNGQFLAAGTKGWVYASPNGIDWTLLSGWPFIGTEPWPPVNLAAKGLAIGNGKVVLIGGETFAGGASAVFVSPDAVRWSAGASPGAVTSPLVFAQGVFVCGGSNGRIFRSTDAATWETALVEPADDAVIRLIHNGRQFVALTGRRQIFLSDDGRAWTAQHALAPGVGPIASSGSVHVLGQNGRIFVSADWRTWVEAVMPNAYDVHQIAYGNGAFVAYNSPWSRLVSQDGVVWTSAPDIAGASYERVAFAGGRFLTFSDYAGHAWSLNGTTWNPMVWEQTALDRARHIGLPDELAASSDDLTIIAGKLSLMIARRTPVSLGIIEQPVSQIIRAGEAAMLRVNTAGAGLSYQWFEGNAGDVSRPIAGAKAATFATGALTVSRDYWVRVAFNGMTQSSTTAHVEVLSPPVISAQPIEVVTTPGGDATFQVTAVSPAPVGYQWFFNGTAIAGATANSYAITGVQPVQGGAYHVAISSAYGVTLSQPARLRGPNAAPVIQSQPPPAQFVAGRPASLGVAAAGTGTLAYQWRRDGISLPGVTSAMLSLTPASRALAGTYDVVVSDGMSTTVSAAAPVRVAPSAYPEVLLADPAFTADLSAPGGLIAGFLRLSDGRAIAFGSFLRVNDVAARHVVRFDSTGIVDAAYARAIANDAVLAAALQPDGRLVIGGIFTRIDDQPRAGLARLNVDGTLDASFVPDASYVGARAIAVQADGRIVVGGEFPGRLAWTNAAGARDAAFAPAPDAGIFALLGRSDGGFVAAGAFTTIAGQPRQRIARFSADGTLTAPFGGTAFNGDVYALGLASSDRVFAAGAFSTFNGQPAAALARFAADDTFDAAWSAPGGFDAPVTGIEVLPDDRVLAAGAFFRYRGISRRKVTRIAANGAGDFGFSATSIDSTVSKVTQLGNGTVLIGGDFEWAGSTFSPSIRYGLAQLSASGSSVVATFGPGLISGGAPSKVRVGADGKLLVAGDFVSPSGSQRFYLTRLLGNGPFDTAFNAGGAGPDGPIRDLFAQPDGRWIIAGQMSNYNGATAGLGTVRLTADGARDPGFNSNWTYWTEWAVPAYGGKTYVLSPSTEPYLRRLNSDGSTDAAFNAGGSSNLLTGAVEQPDGRLVVIGSFTFFNGARNRIVRLLPSGIVDVSFNAGADGPVRAVALQPDGRIVIAGEFSAINGVPRKGVARLFASGALDAACNPGAAFDGPVTGLALQEDGRLIVTGAFATVPGSADTAWAARLQPDGRIDASFAIPGLLAAPAALELLDNGSMLLSGRRRGAVATPFVRLVSQARPAILAQPAGGAIPAGHPATLSVAGGGGAIAYQWYRDGAALAGATGATLSLARVTAADAGRYTVVVVFAAGAVTSEPITLTVQPVASGLVSATALASAAARAPLAAFTIEGGEAKRMLVRVVGPALAGFGVANFAVDPALTLVDAANGAVVGANDDWSTAANAAEVISVTAALGAYPLASDSKDAALLIKLPPGTHRLQATADGVASLEIYDADSSPRLVSAATRATVTAGGVFVQGFTLRAPAVGRSYLIRALGPSLGLGDALADPQVSVFAGSTLLAANDNWGGDPALAVLAANVGAKPLAAESRDAALRFTPAAAGAYTVEVSGMAGATGAVLLEIIEADTQRSPAVSLAIISPPENAGVDAGQPASLGVVVVARPPAAYQWSRDGIVLAGATNASLVLPRAQVADAGTYSVRITSAGAPAQTATGTLTVNATNNAHHMYEGRGYTAEGAVTISNTLHYLGTPATIGWNVELPAGWSVAGDTAATASIKPAAGASGTLAWTLSVPPPSPATFTYTLNIPAGETAARTLAATATVGSDASFAVAPNPLTVPLAQPLHSADTNGDNRISLLELTRVIELYNTRNGSIRTGAYRVEGTGEDGFAPDTARTNEASVALATYHSADSNRDARLNLVELTRVIQLYNHRSGTTRTGQYHVQGGTEDGFAAGP